MLKPHPDQLCPREKDVLSLRKMPDIEVTMDTNWGHIGGGLQEDDRLPRALGEHVVEFYFQHVTGDPCLVDG